MHSQTTWLLAYVNIHCISLTFTDMPPLKTVQSPGAVSTQPSTPTFPNPMSRAPLFVGYSSFDWVKSLDTFLRTVSSNFCLFFFFLPIWKSVTMETSPGAIRSSLFHLFTPTLVYTACVWLTWERTMVVRAWSRFGPRSFRDKEVTSD